MWSRDVPQKIWDPIGSAVLTLIGYKQTDRQAKLIYLLSLSITTKVFKGLQAQSLVVLHAKIAMSDQGCGRYSQGFRLNVFNSDNPCMFSATWKYAIVTFEEIENNPVTHSLQRRELHISLL